MEKIVNDILKEEVYYEKLQNGLDVYFMPKRGFMKSMLFWLLIMVQMT